MVKLDQDILLQLIGCFYLFAAHIYMQKEWTKEAERETESERELTKHQALFKRAYVTESIKHKR